MDIKDILLTKEPIEPETIRQLFPMLFDADIEKINAVRTVLHTRFFFEDMYIFEKIVLALNGKEVDFDYLQSCTPEEIWYAIDLVSIKLRPNIEYAWEVQAYVKGIFNDVGVYIYPSQLEDLANPYYKRATELASRNEFNEDDIEHIQASKYKVIQTYVNNMKHKNQLAWR